MTLHASAVATLSGWVAPTPAQGALRDRYLAHLAAHPDGLAKACFPDHLTAVDRQIRDRFPIRLPEAAMRPTPAWMAA